MLTTHTIKSRALALHNPAHRCRAKAASFAFAVIHKILLLKITCLPISTNEVAQGTATLLDGGSQNTLNGGGQFFIASAGYTFGGRVRIDARLEQTFTRIDITNTNDDVTGQQNLLDRRAALSTALIQASTQIGAGEWLYAKAAQ